MEDSAVLVHAGDALPGDEHEGVRRAKEDVDEELEEELLVIKADAVVHPWAVMVHSGDASFANRAVMAQGRFHGIALLAVLHHYVLQVLQGGVVQHDFLLHRFSTV